MSLYGSDRKRVNIIRKNAVKVCIISIFLGRAICISAQANQYPNELKGYDFFGSGKLKDLHLTASSKNDVKKVFGENCEKHCDYDEDWLISFKYFEDIWVKTDRNEKDEKLTYFLDSKYLGKLRSVEIRPKKQVSFVNVAFSNAFQQLVSTTITDARTGKSSMTANDAFQDLHGLSYELYSRTNYDDIKSKKKRRRIIKVTWS